MFYSEIKPKKVMFYSESNKIWLKKSIIARASARARCVRETQDFLRYHPSGKMLFFQPQT